MCPTWEDHLVVGWMCPTWEDHLVVGWMCPTWEDHLIVGLKSPQVSTAGSGRRRDVVTTCVARQAVFTARAWQCSQPGPGSVHSAGHAVFTARARQCSQRGPVSVHSAGQAVFTARGMGVFTALGMAVAGAWQWPGSVHSAGHGSGQARWHSAGHGSGQAVCTARGRLPAPCPNLRSLANAPWPRFALHLASAGASTRSDVKAIFLGPVDEAECCTGSPAQSAAERADPTSPPCSATAGRSSFSLTSHIVLTGTS